ncbi:MAG: riboflavin synthase [Phycisphaerales bacterium]|nr:riboflavin synthase [Phycisphaerales bacterium]
MFTGLIQAMGEVAGVEHHSQGMGLQIQAAGWEYRAAMGDSIAIAGVCLTVARMGGRGVLGFDAVPETLAKTTLGALKAGDRVNLEHAARADTLLGGHMVQGHVDGVGAVRTIEKAGGEWRVTIAPPEELLPLIAPKGSIAVDGVSLTVASVAGETFDVALIPTTLELTTLRDLQVGSRVNIETDIIARQVARYLELMTAR